MKNQKPDIYELVTNKIIALLENGKVPWKQLWTKAGHPINLLTKKPYRGVNILLLNALGFSRNFFLTFDQVKAVGGSVKKGQKSQMIVFWKWIDVKKPDTTPPDEKKEQKPVLRYYYVFNVDQCTGIPEHLVPTSVPITHETIQSCESIVESMPLKPKIQNIENEAYYDPEADYINVPPMEWFIDSYAYYGTLFHEMTHSTGHKSRLNRKELTTSTLFASEQYSIEELIAEIGACFLQSYARIEERHIENSGAYIQGWLTRLRNDKRFIVYASCQAQKATDYILQLDADRSQDAGDTLHTQNAS